MTSSRRYVAGDRPLAEIAPGTIVLAVVGAADETSIDDLVAKARLMLTFAHIDTLAIDLRAATRIDAVAVAGLRGVLHFAQQQGRCACLRAVPEHLLAVADEIGAG